MTSAPAAAAAVAVTVAGCAPFPSPVQALIMLSRSVNSPGAVTVRRKQHRLNKEQVLRTSAQILHSHCSILENILMSKKDITVMLKPGKRTEYSVLLPVVILPYVTVLIVLYWYGVLQTQLMQERAATIAIVHLPLTSNLLHHLQPQK